MSRGNAIETKHDLDFESCQYEMGVMIREMLSTLEDDDPFSVIEWQIFRVGTCEGQWRMTPEAYEILSIINSTPGNGHLEDVLEWFEYASRRSNLPLRILRFTNERFKKHLIEKRGFQLFGKEDVEKRFPHDH